MSVIYFEPYISPVTSLALYQILYLEFRDSRNFIDNLSYVIDGSIVYWFGRHTDLTQIQVHNVPINYAIM